MEKNMTKQLQIMDEVIAEIMVNAFAPFAEMGEKYGITYDGGVDND